MNVQVLPGDSPASIAQRLTGDPRRGVELVLANPYKKRVSVPGGATFQSLRAGEMLTVPSSWGAYMLAGLPQGVGVGRPGAGLGAAVNVPGNITVGQAVTVSATGLSAPDQSTATWNSSLGSTFSSVSVVDNPNNDSTGTASATYVPAAAGTDTVSFSDGTDADNASTDVVVADNTPTPTPTPTPDNTSFPSNVTADAQAVLAAINADSNYCTSVGQNGSAVNVAVHNFKVDWNAALAANQLPAGAVAVPVGTGQYEAVTAAAVSTALGGNGPLACATPTPNTNPPNTNPPNTNPPNTNPPNTNPPNTNPPNTNPPNTNPPNTGTSSATPWLIAGGIVLLAGVGYVVYRNREHPTVQRAAAATKRGAARVGSAARSGARRVGSAARRVTTPRRRQLAR
jgi:LPXTG-motif cell wall-anchored protein